VDPEPKANVLLVDDQPSNLLALEAILEPLDLNLVKAQSGIEALKRLLDEDFAIILLDVQMPGMNGFEAAELIRARDRSRHVPIIFITGVYRTDVEMFKGYEVGAVDYLFKPILPEVLRSKVNVFAELFRKTEMVKRQQARLRESERREHERALAQEKQNWEMEQLRIEAAREKRMVEELAEADRRKDEFLAMLAHELRNPLAPIQNALALMKMYECPPEIEAAREIVERQSRQMARLVDDLLDVSRISRGKIQLRQEPVRLGCVVERAVESTQPILTALNHRLTLSLPSEPVWLFADPTRLEQVLANLLNNAAKYTEPGGQIHLSAEVARGEGDPPGEVIVRVRDTGIGIEPDKLELIFGLFTQVGRSLNSSSQWGLGIGLALVRTLVEMHGGKVTAFSEGLGKGSEFVVRLPLLREQKKERQAEMPRASGVNGRPLRILVVDDNQDAAESLALLLGLQGHKVRTAVDGPAALEIARNFHPNVILLDIGLPKMDGYQVARRLREDERMRDVFLAAMTGYGQDEDRRRTRDAGFDCHLVKPVDPETLEDLLARLIPKGERGYREESCL
jgi:signal transduction histidine kinase